MRQYLTEAGVRGHSSSVFVHHQSDCREQEEASQRRRRTVGTSSTRVSVLFSRPLVSQGTQTSHLRLCTNSCVFSPFLPYTTWSITCPRSTLQRNLEDESYFQTCFQRAQKTLSQYFFLFRFRIVLIWVFYVAILFEMFLHTSIFFQDRENRQNMIYPGHNIRKHPEAESWWHWVNQSRRLPGVSSLHPPRVCGEELQATCPYYFGTTKVQCQDLSWPHSATLTWHLCCKANNSQSHHRKMPLRKRLKGWLLKARCSS